MAPKVGNLPAARSAAPVDVAIVARLRRLVADPASPVHADGGDAEELAAVTARCLVALSDR
jgi:hypothetical protein